MAFTPSKDQRRRDREQRKRDKRLARENARIEKLEAQRAATKAAEEAANADPDKKIAPEVENFVTTYYEFSGTFTTNLRNSTKFLQVGIGVSTQYDDTVMANVEMHQLSLRSEILGMMSEFSEEEIQGKAGRDALSAAIAEAINKKLIEGNF